MKTVLAPFVLAGRFGKILLVLGLIVGLTSPSAAMFLRSWLSELVALLLFLAAIRIGGREALGQFSDFKASLLLTIVLQFVLPVGMILLLTSAGWIESEIALPLVLVLAAPSISSSPSLTLMIGHNPSPALRLMIMGTALLPLTIILPFWLLPEMGAISDVFHAATRLFLVITIAVGLAFVVRYLFLRTPSASSLLAIDGMNAIVMSVMVIGLMSAVAPAISQTPLLFLRWLGIAFIVNYGLQFVTFFILKQTPLDKDKVGYSIIAGNRNIALFLVALDPAVLDNLLLFIGCYQIPMFLVPVLMKKFYR